MVRSDGRMTTRRKLLLWLTTFITAPASAFPRAYWTRRLGGRDDLFSPEFPYGADDDDNGPANPDYHHIYGLRWARKMVERGVDPERAAKLYGLELHDVMVSLNSEAMRVVVGRVLEPSRRTGQAGDAEADAEAIWVRLRAVLTPRANVHHEPARASEVRAYLEARMRAVANELSRSAGFGVQLFASPSTANGRRWLRDPVALTPEHGMGATRWHPKSGVRSEF
jgi:hypothetical protein